MIMVIPRANAYLATEMRLIIDSRTERYLLTWLSWKQDKKGCHH